MKQRWFFSLCMILVMSMSFVFVTGCGKNGKEDPDNIKTEEQDNDRDETQDNEQDEGNQEDPDDISEDPAGNNPQTRTVTVYYVDDQTAEVTGKSVEIQDEYDIWNALIESGILTEECELLSLNVNEAEKKMDLDFNSATGDRIRSMGTTGETQIIGCIINTYLEAYGCEGIRLTEEGQALVTSHGANFDGYSGKMPF